MGKPTTSFSVTGKSPKKDKYIFRFIIAVHEGSSCSWGSAGLGVAWMYTKKWFLLQCAGTLYVFKLPTPLYKRYIQFKN